MAFEDVGVTIGDTPILHGITFDVHPGRTLSIVGESGLGKSMTALAAMRLLPRGARLSGRIHFGERDLARLDERSMQDVRGGEIGMIFQEPMTALNPLKTIGVQVTERIRLHGVRPGGTERDGIEGGLGLGADGYRERSFDPRRVGTAEAARLAAATLDFSATGSAYMRSLIAASVWAPDPDGRRASGGVGSHVIP